MDDLISRQAVIELAMQYCPDDDGSCSKADRDIRELLDDLEELPSAKPTIIRCKECIYYDAPHIENNGKRYEYCDMPKAAFDPLGTGLVNLDYGINVGGMCCRDYNKGYSEDKRVFRSENDFCSYGERGEE